MGRIKKISKYTPSILQGRLDFSAARKSISLTAEHPYESAILRIIVISILALVFGYLYFVGASILHVVARKEMNAEATRLQSAIAVMEREYFALSGVVDESIAPSLGLSAVQKTTYVYEPGTAVAVTMPGNDI